MEFGGLTLSQESIQRVLSSPEGRQLLALLMRDGGAALAKAGDAVRRGDQAAAEAILSPIMNTTEAQALIDKINRS